VPSRSQYHHGNLRRALVVVARRNVTQGRQDWSLRDIAKDVGVSSAAPYRHFENRDALLDAVAADVAEELASVLDVASAQCRARPSIAVLARAYVKFAHERSREFRACAERGEASVAVLTPVWQKLADTWAQSARSDGRPGWHAARALIHGAAVLAATGVDAGDLEAALKHLAG
jgi:AcrR family transcriptional regulator